MKKLLLLFILSSLIIGCHSLKNKELYEITDKYVKSLDLEYDHYGLFGEDPTYTSDGKYKVQPIGRLINIRIEEVASKEDYEILKKELLKHYDGNRDVNNVYISGGGTIMIDCRR